MIIIYTSYVYSPLSFIITLCKISHLCLQFFFTLETDKKTSLDIK